MKKILIVSIKSGAGHVMAAQALEQELKVSRPDIDVRNIDLLDHATILSKKFYGKWYLDLVNAVPQFYGWLYDNINSDSTRFRLIFDRINAQKYQELIFDYNPDLIIATHFVPCNMATFWKNKYQKNYKVAVALTDYEAHNLWADKLADRFFVATGDVKSQLTHLGIDQEKIITTGIPINAKYSKNFNLAAIRKKLNINNEFTILITSGGFGMGPVKEMIERIQLLPYSINILAMTGHNAELFNELRKMPDQENHKKIIFPFIDNDEELMSVSDVIVGKPGGLTVSEALAVHTPVIMINPIPGQEVANANYLARNLAGLRAEDIDELIAIIDQLIEKNNILEQLRSNIKNIAKPHASTGIINDVTKLL